VQVSRILLRPDEEAAGPAQSPESVLRELFLKRAVEAGKSSEEAQKLWDEDTARRQASKEERKKAKRRAQEEAAQKIREERRARQLKAHG